jgi:hypothetical protein
MKESKDGNKPSIPYKCFAQVTPEQDLRALSGSLPRPGPGQQRCVAAATAVGGIAAADAAVNGPAPAGLRVAEEVVEASYARGLAAAECFEVMDMDCSQCLLSTVPPVMLDQCARVCPGSLT